MIGSKDITTSVNKYQRYLFFLMVLLFPFTHFPLSLPFAGSTPYTLCIIIGYAFFAYEIFVKNVRLDRLEKFGFIFLIISIGWMGITGVFGVLNYQYYEQINLVQMDKFKIFFDNVSIIYPLNELKSIKIWQCYKEIQQSIFNVIYTYLVSLWIYHLYRDNWRLGFLHLRRSIVVLCSCLFIYSLFEINYLVGGNVGQNILAHINPIYMKIADVHGWWPPLFWEGQVRSLFAEPSFLGIFSALAMPVLSSFYFIKRLTIKSIPGILLHMGMAFLIVLSKARTGTVLFIGEIELLIIWVTLFNRKLWKRILLLLFCTGLIFFIGIKFISQFSANSSVNHQDVNMAVEGYVKQNLTSVVGNKRSNNARKANVFATVRIGMEHPLFGIGHGLKDMYLNNKLEPDDFQNHEVANWSAYMYEKGPLKSAYPTLNQLAGVFAEQGFLGVIIFLFPICYIFIKLWKRKNLLCDYSIACISVALIGLIVAFFSNTAMIYYYVAIGFALVAVNCNQGGKQIK